MEDYLKSKKANKTDFDIFMDSINDDDLIALKEWKKEASYSALVRFVEEMKTSIINRSLLSTNSMNNLVDFAELQGSAKSLYRVIKLPDLAAKLLENRNAQRNREKEIARKNGENKPEVENFYESGFSGRGSNVSAWDSEGGDIQGGGN